MAIKIQTRQTGIPVFIGDLQFNFDTSDESIEALLGNHQKVVDEISNIKEGDDEGAKKALKKGFDLLLGDGAFKKIYNQTPSTIECTRQLFELLQGITQEFSSLNGMTQQEKVQKYLKAKNKGNSKKKKKVGD
ncbi:hypothetical protein [Lysinibacillus sp.]|uniref:hypothetical protein n=1 Tax=Lysinibacillus sp. TaxID=1869345 RepID=UPI0028AB6DFA|nr:hypothetical protein [Lysinibacillus sp.]